MLQVYLNVSHNLCSIDFAVCLIEFTIGNLYSRADENTILWAYVDVNSVPGPGFAQAENLNSLSINVMVYLDMYESVNVWIRNGQTTSHSDANHFQIQKIV